MHFLSYDTLNYSLYIPDLAISQFCYATHKHTHTYIQVNIFLRQTRGLLSGVFSGVAAKLEIRQISLSLEGMAE